MNKFRVVFSIALVAILLTACGKNSDNAVNIVQGPISEKIDSVSEVENYIEEKNDESLNEKTIINPDGETLESRILTPEGYERLNCEVGSFEEFIRSYHIKEHGEKVHLYDGSEKGNQKAHCAIFDLPIENYDLQQCADSVIRMYAEYFYSTGQYERIAFHYTSGFLAEYTKWRDEYRINVEGNDVSWVLSQGYDDSYECFVKYLKSVFTYAGTLSLNNESKEINLTEAKVGDVFLYGGSPGHVVMIVDTCVNENGNKAFLLAQGYMPAQEFHVLVNNEHPEDPWYYEDEISYPFVTPEYIFRNGSLRRLNY